MFESLKNKIKDEFTKQPQGYWSGDKKEVKTPAHLPSAYSFNVAGINYRMDDVQKLATPIKKFTMSAKRIVEIGYANKKIYKSYYTNEPVELRPEPTNQYDPNAIMVLINGIHVGYVPQNDIPYVKTFLGVPVQTFAQISGGEYRVVMGESDDKTFSEPLTIVVKLRR